ncbi:Apc15p protein-domain-containing protein [Bisporella sp. PMI_857]|nr:Apc15p protein-domain-containing protein [Bisporella sp. PMI_857]
MYSLPTLAPQDSYSLWYTSSHNPQPAFHPPQDSSDIPSHPTQHPQVHRRHHVSHRTPLTRLCHDEEYLLRRKLNIKDYGNSWIRPPGIPKSLFQLREEKRELEEHQEALRREALAQELAEAEMQDEMGLGEGGEGEGEGEGEEVVDLDDAVPEADATALDAEDDYEEEEEDVPRGVLASRLPDDAYREALVRGTEPASARFGEGDSALEEEDASHMLQEEDLLSGGMGEGASGEAMDVDLDADVPDADEEEEYEHTDTDEELSSSEDESEGEAAFPRGPPAASSMVRSDGTQNSMDLSSPQTRQSFGRRY